MYALDGAYWCCPCGWHGADVYDDYSRGDRTAEHVFTELAEHAKVHGITVTIDWGGR